MPAPFDLGARVFFAESAILGIEDKNPLFARGFLVVNEVDLRRYAFSSFDFFLLRKSDSKNTPTTAEATTETSI